MLVHVECMLMHGGVYVCVTVKLVLLNHPQLSPYGSAHHIFPIRVWRRTLNCMVYSYQCLQIVH